MSDNHFATVYRTLPTEQLLDILDNSHEYQPLAVEAALREIENRRLSGAQLETARAERKKQVANEDRNRIAIENKIKLIRSSIVNFVNPIQQDDATAERRMQPVLVFIGAMFIYALYHDYELIRFMLVDEMARWDFSMILHFLPFVILPASCLLLWRKKKFGWILSVFFFANVATEAAVTWLAFGFSPGLSIGTITIYAVAIWVMTRKDIRVLYNIDNPTMLVTIGVGAASLLLHASIIVPG